MSLVFSRWSITKPGPSLAADVRVARSLRGPASETRATSGREQSQKKSGDLLDYFVDLAPATSLASRRGFGRIVGSVKWNWARRRTQLVEAIR